MSRFKKDHWNAHIAHTQHDEMQRVPAKMRFEMLIRMKLGILTGQSSAFFLHEPFQKRPVIAI